MYVLIIYPTMFAFILLKMSTSYYLKYNVNKIYLIGRGKVRHPTGSCSTENFANLIVSSNLRQFWDTKLLENITGNKVDGLAVISISHVCDKL